MTDSTQRIETLEVRAAYQDEAIESLNATVLKQWREIDALKRQLAELSEQLRDAEITRPVGPGNDPPPHY